MKHFIITISGFIFSALLLDGCSSSNSLKTTIVYESYHSDNVKAGYSFYYNNTKDLIYYDDLGLNTVFLKVWESHDEKKWERSLRKIQEWSLACRSRKMDLYIMINFHPYPYMNKLGLKYASTPSGERSDAVDALQEEFWNKHIDYTLISLSKFISKNNIRVNGFIIDTEVYSDKKLQQYRRSFESKDISISQKQKEHLINRQGDTEGNKAKKTTESNQDLLELARRKFIKNKFVEVFSKIRQQIPSATFGMYPHPTESNFIQMPLAQAIGSKELPGLILSIESYGYKQSPDGTTHQFITPRNTRDYHNRGINANYLSGFLLRKLNAEQLQKSIQLGENQSDGFWLYRMPDFTKNKAKSSIDDYKSNLNIN